MAIDITAFLERIGLAGPVAPDFESLRAIHWAHLQTVPFENLDIRPLGMPISLEIAEIEEKIVRRRRGGFCYELNGLMAAALSQIGFEVTRVASRFLLDNGQFTPLFDHMALLVRPEGASGRYLVDVGCGRSSPAFPLPLIEGNEEDQPEIGHHYRLMRIDEEWQLELRTTESVWKPQYRFTETAYALSDFDDRCRFQWSHPESHFTQGPLCSMNLVGGRITMTGTSLIRTLGADRTETVLANEAEFHRALCEHFGIVL